MMNIYFKMSTLYKTKDGQKRYHKLNIKTIYLKFACAFWMQLFSVSILLNLEWGATNHLLRNCVFLQNRWTESFDFPT